MSFNRPGDPRNSGQRFLTSWTTPIFYVPAFNVFSGSDGHNPPSRLDPRWQIDSTGGEDHFRSATKRAGEEYEEIQDMSRCPECVRIIAVFHRAQPRDSGAERIHRCCEGPKWRGFAGGLCRS